MGTFFIMIVRVTVQLFSLLIIIDSVLSFMLSPNHTLREALGRLLNPLYAPIRRFVPPAGGFDFSPIVLLLVIQVLGMILIRLFGGI